MHHKQYFLSNERRGEEEHQYMPHFPSVELNSVMLSLTHSYCGCEAVMDSRRLALELVCHVSSIFFSRKLQL